MKEKDLASKIVYYTTLIVIAFIIASVLWTITSASAVPGGDIIHERLDIQKEQIERYQKQVSKKEYLQQHHPVITVWVQVYYPKDTEYRWKIVTLTLVPTRDMMPFEEGTGCYLATGCYDNNDATMWILQGWEGIRSKTGCSPLYHEILHVKGLNHTAMENDPRYANWACSV